MHNNNHKHDNQMRDANAERLYEFPNAIDPRTCRDFIDRGNRSGWIESDIRQLNPLFSRSQTCIFIDTTLLFAAVSQSLPEALDGMQLDSLVPDRTSCMRYLVGEYFGLHSDSPFCAHDGQSIAKLSLVLYLNDDYQGGETVFPDLNISVRPQVGKFLAFAPATRHSSTPIIEGTKYIIRSEVLYRTPQIRLSATRRSDGETTTVGVAE
jgi:hypothetical protein